MKTYGQYCPIARGAEIFAERWTPIILRNILLGSTTFTEIQRGAPGIPRSLLTSRLVSLERQGVIERRPLSGRGYRYLPTPAGKELFAVLRALGEWGARWLEVEPQHLDPSVALWSMSKSLNVGRLPGRRTVVRFEFVGVQRHGRLWLLIENGQGEVCAKAPGDEDLVVTADPDCFVRWHMGELTWSQAVAADGIRVDGPRQLAREFPRWNNGSSFAHIKRTRDSVPA